ncbi:antibiotic biosynthesis monooxygenase [Actinoplanes sp. NPDC023714]|uniref:putative quinol monooxygenase n=1 Tax=Actinoplanes sp. NPDC023714 TaxID=3154322 RepID=UPI003403FF24
MYGYFGTMKAKPGHRDAVVEILVSGAGGLKAAGAHLYVVGVSDTDEQTIFVNEVWESKEHHDASLQLPETRAAIATAMPMLTGEFSSTEARIVGGLGV